jgi:Domain of unknown function (DUF4249)
MCYNRICYSILIIILIISSSCEREATNVILPEFTHKLSITSFLSPSDTISYVFVSSNQRIYGELNSEESTGNLSAFIYDGSREIALDTFNTGFIIRHDQMDINYGTTYKLRVISDIGLSAEAISTVPEKRIFFLKADTSSILEQYPGRPAERVFYTTVTFTDYPGEDNYYKLFEVKTSYSTDPETGKVWENNSSYTLFKKSFFTDNGMDGKEISQRTEGTGRGYYSSPDSDPDSVFMKIYLLNTEKSYFQFHQSLLNYDDGTVPFSETSPLFSNINGGLGIFSAYTVDSIVIRIK